MIRSIILLYISIVLVSCNTKKKYANYNEAVATITSYGKYPDDRGILFVIITGNSSQNHNSVTWSNYTFTVKRKTNEFSPDEGEKNPYYDFNIYGEDLYGEIGEKFIVIYDPKKYDNDHNFLIRYKAIFLDEEKTITTKGKITKIYGKDVFYKDAIAIEFKYNVSTSDSLKNTYFKYQYLSPGLNIDSLNVNMNTGKEFKVLYSPENPKRAIIYYNQR